MTKKKNKYFVYLRRNYLINIRSELGISQKEVAKRAEMEPTVYNCIENGKLGSLMNEPKLLLLAQALGLEVKELCELERDYLKKVKEVNET